MRYTKELQADVCNDIKYGLTPQECSEKYNIPVSVVIKWNGLDYSEQKAAEVALRKYQKEISDTETDITDSLARYLDPNLSDEAYFKVCDIVTKPLYKLVKKVVQKERELHPKEEPKSDAQIIFEITNRWSDNKFIKMYSL